MLRGDHALRLASGNEGDGLDNSQLCALFENCLKLASENKITAKNTWDLPLIDHLSDLVQVRASFPQPAP